MQIVQIAFFFTNSLDPPCRVFYNHIVQYFLKVVKVEFWTNF